MRNDPRDGHLKPLKLTSATFDAFYAQLGLTTTAQPVVDLRTFTFVSSSVLVQLAALCHALANNGQHASLLLQDHDLRAYLSRAGFVSAIASIAQVHPAIPPAQAQWYAALAGEDPLLIEVILLQHEADLNPLLNRVMQALRRRLHYRQRDAALVTQVVSEITHNMLEHTPLHRGFFAMQVYGKHTQRFLEIGVSDDGPGLLATLRHNSALSGLGTEADALRQAVQLGTSEYGQSDMTRGTGLYHLLRLVSQQQGQVFIRSGDRKLIGKGQRQSYVHAAAMPGVHICLQLPTKVTA